MIYTVTFNPALDITGTVEEVVPNEKNYVLDEIRTPGGNGINVGIIASRLGAPVSMTGFLGGANGEEIKALLEKEKARKDFISISDSTRINITVSNQKNPLQTRLSFPGPKIKSSELKSLEESLDHLTEGDLLVLGGSLPPGIKLNFITKLVKKFCHRKIPCIVDMPGEQLREVIEAKPFFIKPNLTEFQTLMRKKVSGVEEVRKASRALLEKIPVVCVSSVEGGALLMTKDEAWFGKIPKVKIHSTVGAGDSMVGGMVSLWQKDEKAPLEELLRIGLAASCATLTERGLTLGSKKNILKFRDEVFVQCLKR